MDDAVHAAEKSVVSVAIQDQSRCYRMMKEERSKKVTEKEFERGRFRGLMNVAVVDVRKREKVDISVLPVFLNVDLEHGDKCLVAPLGPAALLRVID